jgi:hypothetical protein
MAGSVPGAQLSEALVDVWAFLELLKDSRTEVNRDQWQEEWGLRVDEMLLGLLDGEGFALLPLQSGRSLIETDPILSDPELPPGQTPGVGHRVAEDALHAVIAERFAVVTHPELPERLGDLTVRHPGVEKCVHPVHGLNSARFDTGFVAIARCLLVPRRHALL